MKVKCITNKRKSYLIENNIYIVVGLMFDKRLSEKELISILIMDEYNSAGWFELSLFEIIDNNIPMNWTFNFIYEDMYVISFKEYNNIDFNNALLDCGRKEYLIFELHYKELQNWYRDMEIDEFFTESEKYGIIEDEKRTMLEYYKSQPDSIQWDQDKILLKFDSDDFTNRKDENK